jgi:D-threo-aldose 1-dehydrogenase
MQRIKLHDTDILTTVIGFGCASLFHLARADERRSVLEVAFDAGIRHFDVAPMYGLGMAEGELQPFFKGRRDDITVTTKFGINTTPLGGLAGRAQRPIRVALSRRPAVGSVLKQSGVNPTSGWVGKLLYSSSGYTADSAAVGLHRSLKAMGTDYVDVFLLHDPRRDLLKRTPELVGYLNEQIRVGKIRSWGVASDTYSQDAAVSTISSQGNIMQTRDNIFERSIASQDTNKARITFGILGYPLQAIAQYFERLPHERKIWSERLGIDLSNGVAVANLLVRNSLSRNKTGPVLFSSTRSERVRAAAEQASVSSDSSFMQNEGFALNSLISTIKRGSPQDPT